MFVVNKSILFLDANATVDSKAMDIPAQTSTNVQTIRAYARMANV